MPFYRPCPIGTLETKRLILRPVELADADRIQKLFGCWNVLKFMATAVPWPFPVTGAKDYIESILPRIGAMEQYYWVIIEKALPDRGLVGVIALTPSSDNDNRGFWLGEEFWGRGIMKEANLAVNDFAFGPLEMQELRLNNAAPNLASHRLKELAGAEIVAVTQDEYNSGRFDTIRWRLTAEQWTANRHNFERE